MDVWRAYEEGTFGTLRPWLGYVFLLEETRRSITPVRVATGVFQPETIFQGTSYKDRYGILCQRLVRERLYDAACFATSSRDSDSPVHQPYEELSFGNFVAAIVGRSAFVKALDQSA